MASKVLKPVNEKQEQVPVQEKFLEVRDVAHEEPQSASFVQEEMTLSEKEAEYKQKMGREESGKSDLEEERETKRVQVEDSLDSFEKDRVRVQKKRIDRNIQTANQASKEQLARMRAIQADNVAKMSSGASVKTVSPQIVMNQNDSVTNILSMMINDALMNSGKERGDYEEDHIGEKFGLFGGHEGRQKTILINGVMVTLDEDVAEAIMKHRAPVLNQKSKVLQGSSVQDSVQEFVAENGVVVDEVPEVDTDDIVAVKNADLSLSAEQAYLDSKFHQLEQNLASDRKEMENIFVSYHPYYVPVQREYEYGVDYGNGGKSVRKLPDVSWGDVSSDYLPNGRRLPYIDASYEEQMQFGL